MSIEIPSVASGPDRTDFAVAWQRQATGAIAEVRGTIRRGPAIILTVSKRFPALSAAGKRISIPDWVVSIRAGSLRGLLKLVNWDGSLATRTMPDARCMCILRHPDGRIASMMAGQAGNHLKTMFGLSEPPETVAAAVAIASRGFDALPDAAKYACSWCAFNEPAVAALRGLPNARIVLYENLCRQPEQVSRDLFAFARLKGEFADHRVPRLQHPARRFVRLFRCIPQHGAGCRPLAPDHDPKRPAGRTEHPCHLLARPLLARPCSPAVNCPREHDPKMILNLCQNMLSRCR